MQIGKEALARVLNQLKSETEPDIEVIWPDFVIAVQVAIAEGREREAEGIRKWRDAAHTNTP